MIVFSHIKVGNYFFHVIKKNKMASFKLSWGAFVFGNVYPDISKFSSVKHYYETTRSIYKCFQMKVRNPENKAWERSMALGVVCHFICDYFCKYHAKMPYAKKSMILHISYEVILHMKIINILFKKNIGVLGYNEQSIFHSIEDRNAAASSFDLQNTIMDYENNEESLMLDVAFAFGSVKRVMKEMLGIEESVSDEINEEKRIRDILFAPFTYI